MLAFRFHNGASILALSVSCAATSVLKAQEGVALSTPTFGFLSSDKSSDGKEYSYVYDSSGNILKTIDLTDHVARPGSNGFYALLTRKITDGNRTATIYDSAGELRCEFLIGAEEEIRAGKYAALVTPYHMCASEEAFQLRFVGLDGKTLVEQSRDDVWLTGAGEVPSGDWFVVSVLKENRNIEIRRYSGTGGELWKFGTGQGQPPTLATSASGNYNVIGVFLEDSALSRLHLLDAQGKETHDLEVPAFNRAVFSPNEKYLLLCHESALQLRAAHDGTAIWVKKRDYGLAPGSSCSFSADSSTFYVVGQTLNAESATNYYPVTLRAYSIGPGDVSYSETSLDPLRQDRLPIIAMRELNETELLLTTSFGFWTVKKPDAPKP